MVLSVDNSAHNLTHVRGALQTEHVTRLKHGRERVFSNFDNVCADWKALQYLVLHRLKTQLFENH